MGGGGTDIEYTQSPEQRQMYRMINPVINKIATSALGYNPQTVKGVGGKGGKGGGALPPNPVNEPLYNLPNPELMMPTGAWWDSLSPNVMEGLWSPVNEGARQMMETMGMSGQLGSGRGGFSGAGGTALGKFYEDAAQNVGLQAWQMTGPQMQHAWDAIVQREMLPYAILPGLVGGTYSNPVVGGGGGSALGTIGSAAGMGTAAYGMMASNPVTAAVGITLAALSGGK